MLRTFEIIIHSDIRDSRKVGIFRRYIIFNLLGWELNNIEEYKLKSKSNRR